MTEGIAPTTANPAAAPFLVWPVARREFYIAVAVALLPTLAWGAIVFGWRAFVLILTVLGGALATHLLFWLFTRRGKSLLLAHTIVSALLLACLSRPLWPPVLMLAAGALLVVLAFVFGGPGREWIASSSLVLMLLLASLLLIAHRAGLHPLGDAPPPGDAILARDRLFMGDLKPRAQERVPYAEQRPTAHWPRSRDLGGNDAVSMFQPVAVVNDLLDILAKLVHPRATRSSRSAAESAARITPVMDEALVYRLPGLDTVVEGRVPGAIGCVSATAIFLGGLYLAYRHILRARSGTTFLLSFLAGLVLLMLPPGVLARAGLWEYGRLWEAMPSTLLTLVSYQFFGSDVVFAAIFILALPGTEPITPRGRWVFLVIAGLIGAALCRLSPWPIPAATLGLALLQPFRPLFDRAFIHRSWLNR